MHEELQKAKIRARQKLNSLPPLLAQEIINDILYPHLWDFSLKSENIDREKDILRGEILMLEKGKKTPQDLLELLTKIQSKADLILVGGHAINLWACAYQTKNSQLEAYLPFSSADLDFLGGRIEATICHQILGGQLNLNRNFDSSPNTGVLVTEFKQQPLRIDFLGVVYGLSDREIVETAVEFIGQDELTGISIKVLHPLLCLEGKLKSYVGLPQFGRQDKKHLEISILVVKQYLQDICYQYEPRFGLRIIEQIFKLAKSDAGLQVWHNDNIDITNSVSLELISGLQSEKWQKFHRIRLPQLLQNLALRRDAYHQIK
jgi:hypothetical protein